MESMYDAVMTVFLILVSLGLFACLYRSVKGPTTADRIISINMTGTAVISIILLLGFLLGEAYLADVALEYALISFLAVVLLVRIFVALNRRRGGEDGNDA